MSGIVNGLLRLHEGGEGPQVLLEFIGTSFSADRIMVLERSLDRRFLNAVMEWAVKGWELTLRCLPCEAFLAGKSLDDETFWCADPADMPTGRFFDRPASLVACPLRHSTRACGILTFEREEPWTAEEAATLGLVGKFVGILLRQYHSVNMLRQNQESTRNLLNWVPFYVYVIEQGTHRLLYFNDAVSRAFPDCRIGATCHQTFWNNEQICEFCPSRTMCGASSVTAVLPHSPFWEMSDVSLSNILWENTTPAHIVLIAEHALSHEEKEDGRRREAFGQAMSLVYYSVVDLDLMTGNYEMLSSRYPRSLVSTLSGSYDKDFQYIDSFVHKDFVETFKRLFSIENLRAGNSVELEFLCLSNGEYRWRYRQAFPYMQNDGSMHALSVERDIHDTKQAALNKAHEEAKIQVALRNSYSRIYLLDLETQAFSCLFRNADRLRPFDIIGNYSVDILTVAREIVHPDDVARFDAFFSIAGIRKGLETGQELVLEYRCRSLDDSYAWFSTFVVPVPNAPKKAMFLVRDITERRKMEDEHRSLELRYMTVFRQSCDAFIEISLTTWNYKRMCFRKAALDMMAPTGDYRKLLGSMHASLVHPEDRYDFFRVFDPDRLAEAFHRGRTENIVLHYRLLQDDVYSWKEGRIVFLDEREPVIFILIRDINQQKQLEIQRREEEQRFDLVIRKSYCEIHHVDLLENVAKTIYTTGVLGIVVDRRKNDIAEKLVHPEDRQRFLADYEGKTLQDYFAQGHGEFSSEYRRLGADGTYHWVSASVLPMHSENGVVVKALLLIRDITERKAEENRQRIAEQYDRALRNLYDELYVLNSTQRTYKIIYHAEGRQVTPPDEGELDFLLQEAAKTFIHPDDQERFADFVDIEKARHQLATGSEYLFGEFRKLWEDGTYRWASLTLFPVDSSTGTDEMYLVFVMDITAKKEAEQIAHQNAILELQRLDDERYRTIIEQTDTLVFEWWSQGDKRYLSPEIPARFMGKYEGRELFAVWREDKVIHPDDLPLLDALSADLEGGARHGEMTVRFRTQAGGYIWCRVVVSRMLDEASGAVRTIGTLNDVDAATQSMRELRFRAEYDVLTGVYNMSAFYAQAEGLLRNNPDVRYSIVRMDIDRFKVINDLYGLAEGDKLLQFLAEALAAEMRKDEVYGRLSGDIFCMLVRRPMSKVVELVNRLVERVAAYPLPYKIKVSFGICPVEDKKTPINLMCDWANLAQRTIKGSYIRSYAFYDGKLRERILEEKRIENQMNEALLDGQFVIYLQPKVDIRTSRIIGAESLVRWMHPVEGLIAPDRFIPLFERNGFILRLDECVWEQTCAVLRRWLDQGLTPPPVSVNVSRTHIHDPLLQDKLTRLVQRYAIPAELLQLEMTESAFLDNEEELFATMNQLRQAGFRFSMDDFGTGYSSLNMLTSIPVDAIKIDRGFLNEGFTSDRGRTVIRYSVTMAREMNIGVVAEGVETVEQAVFLLRAGCSCAQGFFYSRPVPVPDFEALAFGERQPPFPIDEQVLRFMGITLA